MLNCFQDSITNPCISPVVWVSTPKSLFVSDAHPLRALYVGTQRDRIPLSWRHALRLVNRVGANSTDWAQCMCPRWRDSTRLTWHMHNQGGGGDFSLQRLRWLGIFHCQLFGVKIQTTSKIWVEFIIKHIFKVFNSLLYACNI
jgi:hypothetical protein